MWLCCWQSGKTNLCSQFIWNWIHRNFNYMFNILSQHAKKTHHRNAISCELKTAWVKTCGKFVSRKLGLHNTLIYCCFGLVNNMLVCTVTALEYLVSDGELVALTVEQIAQHTHLPKKKKASTLRKRATATKRILAGLTLLGNISFNIF